MAIMQLQWCDRVIDQTNYLKVQLSCKQKLFTFSVCHQCHTVHCLQFCLIFKMAVIDIFIKLLYAWQCENDVTV